MPAASLTLAQCEAYYHLPVAEAAQRLGVSRPTISKILRRHGIRRWPYRKLQAERRRIQHRTPPNRPDISPSDRVIQRPLRQARKHRRSQSRSISRPTPRSPSSNQKQTSRVPTPQSESTRPVRRIADARCPTLTPSSANQRQRSSLFNPQSESTKPITLMTEARCAPYTTSENSSQSLRVHTPPSSCPSSYLSSRPSSAQHSPAQPPRCASPTPSEQCLPWPPCDSWGPPRPGGLSRPSSAKAVFGEAWTRGLFTEGNNGTHFQFLAPTERVCIPRLPSSTSLQQECYEEFTQTKEDDEFVIHFGEIDECAFGGIQF